MKNRNIISSLSPPPPKGPRMILGTPRRAFRIVRRVTKHRPTRQQIAITFGRSFQFMMEIRHRAETPFRGAAPGPDYQPAPTYPPSWSRL